MNDVDWQDIKLFLAVARLGNLSKAAALLKSSPATLGRRMLELESSVSRLLFKRSQTGYELTKDGEEFLKRALAMDAGAKPLLDWIDRDRIRPSVRISAGTWTAQFLCENFERLWSLQDEFVIVIVATERPLDIRHREVEIGIRSHKPEGANLAARRTGHVAHGVFQSRSLKHATNIGWVSMLPEDSSTAALRWTQKQPRPEIVAWASTPRTLYDLIAAGVGKGVLPCFAGDRDPRLERIGKALPELHQEQWLVVHNDDRNRGDVRTALDRVGALLNDYATLFSGGRPMGKLQHD
jgi:DNA-binding transcriptional LysR family regulator